MVNKQKQYYKVDIIITGKNLKTNDTYMIDRFNKCVETMESAVEYINVLYPNIKRESIYINNEDKEAIIVKRGSCEIK